MNISPIQLFDTTFLKINIEHSSSMENIENGTHNPSQWDRVSLATYKNFTTASEFWNEKDAPIEGIDKRTFAIQLGLKSSKAEDKEWSPYHFEIEVGVIVAVVPSMEDEDKVKKMAFQYGLQFAFGAIREQVSNLTSRMQWGTMLLPAMSFMDEEPKESSKLEK